MKFFNELKRRNVVKETLAYLIVAWVLLQVASIMLPVFKAPDWYLKTITFTLILGIPLWVFFSWTYQITPGGFQKTKTLSDDHRYSAKTHKRLDIVIIFFLVAATSITIYDHTLIKRLSNSASPEITSYESEIDKSVAVLPFVNMSNDPEQEYFADGLSVELINMFANLPDLRVIGRTSSFAFKGKNEDLRTICEKLGVNYILEGSVRKSGNNIRITVQLIKSVDGSHLWNKTYNRNMDDIFKIQDEISEEVTSALKVTILDEKSIKNKPNIDPMAYDHFLRGRYHYESFIIENSTLKALEWFDKAIEQDSSFSLAWTYRSMCYWRQATNSTVPNYKLAKEAAVKAYELDPSSGIAAVNLGEILDGEYKLNEALTMIDKALELEPTNPYVLRNVGRFYTIIGRHDQSIEYCKQALKNDPIQRTALQYMLKAYHYSGKNKESLELLLEFKDVYPMVLNVYESICVFSTEVKDPQLIEDLRNKMTNEISQLILEFMLDVREDNKKRSEEILNKIILNYPEARYRIAILYAILGEHSKSLDWLEKSYANNDKILILLKVEPNFEPFKQDARFQSLLAKLNYPE